MQLVVSDVYITTLSSTDKQREDYEPLSVISLLLNILPLHHDIELFLF